MARRLSSGLHIASSLIEDTPEKDRDNDKENAGSDDTPAANRTGEGVSRSSRKSMSRRRSSGIGGRRLSGLGVGRFDPNNTDKEKIDSMYSSVINKFAENKITREECWGYHFIDYMKKMICEDDKEAGSASKVNFQKASCTIEASVKIYSHRVDATHEISCTLLDNLSRKDNETARGGAGDAVLGGSEKSAKYGAHETLKKSHQLNLSDVDRAYAVDPMFHKMSKIFDESGSKGMLLNNLSVSNGCQVSFVSDVAPAKTFPRSESDGGDDDDGDNDDNKKCDDVNTIEIEDGDRVPGDEGEGSEKVRKEAEERKNKDDESSEGNLDGGSMEAGRKDSANEAWKGDMVDVSILRATLSGLCSDLSTLPLCPQLEEFRQQIADLEEGADGGRRVSSMTTYKVNASGDSESESDGGWGGFDDIPGGDVASFDGGGAGGGDGAMDDGSPDLGGDVFADESDPFQADSGGTWSPTINTSEEGSNGVRLSFGGVGESGGSMGEAGEMSSAVQLAVGPASLQDRLCSDLKVVDDDYAFYDAAALATAAASNQWAGASHWKFVGRKRKPKRSDGAVIGRGEGNGEVNADGDGDVPSASGGRSARGKKRPPAIDFNGPAVPESAFLPPKIPARARGSRSKKPAQDPTLLSDDYVNSREKAARDGSITYTLPENAGFKAKDLGELFLRAGAFAKRGVAAETAATSGKQYRAGDLQGFHDSGKSIGGAHDGDALRFDIGDGGYGGSDDFDDDDDDDTGSAGFHFALGGDDGAYGQGFNGEAGGVVGVGADGVIVDDFEAEGLISADRRVEKISVNYARKAKRVDVRRLKGDLWRKIDAVVVKEKDKELAPAVPAPGSSGSMKVDNDTVGTAESGDDDLENEEQEKEEQEKKEGAVDASLEKPTPEAEDVTFSHIVHDLASEEEQMGVTVPFYFICVLHLANEKGLKLEGRDDMRDFSVSSDPVPPGSY